MCPQAFQTLHLGWMPVHHLSCRFCNWWIVTNRWACFVGIDRFIIEFFVAFSVLLLCLDCWFIVSYLETSLFCKFLFPNVNLIISVTIWLKIIVALFDVPDKKEKLSYNLTLYISLPFFYSLMDFIKIKAFFSLKSRCFLWVIAHAQIPKAGLTIYLTSRNINFFHVDITSHAKVSDLAPVVFTNQHISCCEVSVNYL